MSRVKTVKIVYCIDIVIVVILHMDGIGGVGMTMRRFGERIELGVVGLMLMLTVVMLISRALRSGRLLRLEWLL